MTTSMRWFANQWQTQEVDETVVNRVLAAKNVLDIGCGHNPYKKFATGKFTGIDVYIDTADEHMDFLNFRTQEKYDLIIAYGVFHFHSLDLIDIQIRKTMKLLTPDGVLCMKVNPNCPNFDGSILPWYNKWTKSLAYHYGEVYNKKVTNMRESTRGRFKWEYE